MFVPVWDENSLKSIRFQVVTVGLILLNVAIFALEAFQLPQQAIASFAVVPAELFATDPMMGTPVGAGELIAVPERLTLLSYMFFHGDIIHLGSNMLFLWVFGDNVEDAMGHGRFLVFYLLCGIAGGLAHAWLLPTSAVPLIGASGAISGIIAAYLMLHPRVRVWVLVMRFLPVRLSAALVLGLWIALQFIMLMVPNIGPIAWWAHIGGLVAGAILILFMRRDGVVLFDKDIRAA